VLDVSISVFEFHVIAFIDGSDYYAQISDQRGRPIDLPAAERRALTLAMVLHEKGRAALKRRQFADALVFLLEADSEFNKCQSSGVLGLVDNYALVCLDICWCYLCLQSFSSLPDAGQLCIVFLRNSTKPLIRSRHMAL